MNIPQHIRIMGIDYPIRHVENLRKDNLICYGHISYDDCCIEISKTDARAHERKCVILWHEIIHAILDNAGEELPKDDEERIISILAAGIYQILKDNGNSFFNIQEKWKGEMTWEKEKTDEANNG